MLTYGAYNGEEPLWQDVRSSFQRNYVRVPVRLLWIPKGSFSEDITISGVLVERDVQCVGLSKKMSVPNIESWRQNEYGIYVSPNGQLSFVPKDKYRPGEHSTDSFAADGLAISVLTPEGAEIFAKTAIDAGKSLWTWGANADQIQKSIQRVSLLYENSDRLFLDGDCWSGNADLRASGVRKETAEASSQKI